MLLQVLSTSAAHNYMLARIINFSLSTRMAHDEREPEVLMAKKCHLCGFIDSNDPGFFILFKPDADIHALLGNPNLNHVNPINLGPPRIPAPGCTAAQSFQALCQFSDDVALAVGMSTNNFTLDAEQDIHSVRAASCWLAGFANWHHPPKDTITTR